MKKIFLFILLSGLYLTSFSQHIIPVEISADPENIEIAVFGAGTIDGGSAAFLESFSSKADIGFVVNALVKRASTKKGSGISYKQFIVNLNPVIIDWNSLDINTVTKTSIDSFKVQRMPFAEDCFLHIGFRSNKISKATVGGGGTLADQKILTSLWIDVAWRPYSFASVLIPGKTLSFQTFNILAGYQYNFFKNNVPTIETFMIGVSPQICFMGVNEDQTSQGNLQEVYGYNNGVSRYHGQNFLGFGGKLTVQIKHLNIFIEGRQYFGMDAGYAGQKFSSEAQMVVGAFGNLKFYTKKPVVPVEEPEDWD